MTPRISANRDPSLSATILSRSPLLYCEGPDARLDRPAHVRAGSSLTWIGHRVALIQDDANFLALIDPQAGRVEAVPLPAGEGGARQFDELRGTKHLKLDLEACVTIESAAGELLAAFGSGSTPRRETVALIGFAPTPQITVHDASAFYRSLRDLADFSGSELNVEGAVCAAGRLRLFNRGNGAPRKGLAPVDATVEVDWDKLAAWLLDPQGDPPPLRNVVQYDLGRLEGQRLGFTDAALTPHGLVFSAAAEDSPDAVRDGLVTGSALGALEDNEPPRWIELRTADGALFPGKVEGVCPTRFRDDRVYVVVDVDDPRLPSELCEVELAGPWRRATR